MSFPERSDGNLRVRLHKESVSIQSAKYTKIATRPAAARNDWADGPQYDYKGL
jgi:hypothetical protein